MRHSSTFERHSTIDLSKFRYHTGAQPTPLDVDEQCPPLFRDVGVEAMRMFLRGQLSRLCGPTSPITYLRTADYREPYTDYGMIGRILLLDPQCVRPWHSGIDTIYIGPREISVDSETMVFVPGGQPLVEVANRFANPCNRNEFVDDYGRREYADAMDETLNGLDRLLEPHQETERMAAPLRRGFQSSDQRQRDEARAWMKKAQLAESDLCTAWHHLPSERREFIQNALVDLPESIQCPAS